MITILYFVFLLLLAIIGGYHWFYLHEVHKTEQQIGLALGGAVRKMLAVNNVLILSLTTFIVALLFINFVFGI